MYVGKGGISFYYKYEITLLSKIKDDLLPKNTLKYYISGITGTYDIHPRKHDIGILDGHSRKSSNDSLYFCWDLFKCFHTLLSNEKNKET